MAYGDNYDYGLSPLYKDDDLGVYYVDLERSGTGYDGTEIDPWSFEDWQAAINLLPAGSTLLMRGQLETLGPAAGGHIEYTGNYAGHKYDAWDPVTNGPWRIKCTGDHTHEINSVMIKNGILEWTDGFVDVGNPTFYGCFLKASYFDMEAYLIGCLVHATSEFEFSGFEFWDTAIRAPQMTGGGCTLRRCALDYDFYTTSGMTLDNVQTDWESPILPLWDDPAFNYRNTYLYADVDTPPQPGTQPYNNATLGSLLSDYTTGLWGNPRTGIGAAFFNEGQVIELTGIPSEEAWGLPSINRITTVISGLPPAEPAREGDIRLYFDTLDQYGEILPVDRDVDRDPGFETAVIITLGTDKYAEEGDPLPEDSGYRGGWWGDAVPPVSDYQMGTKLWLLKRAKTVTEIPAIAKEYLLDGFQWMIDDEIVETINVSVERRRDMKTTLAFTLEFIKPEITDSIFYKFFYNWEAQILRRQ